MTFPRGAQFGALVISFVACVFASVAASRAQSLDPQGLIVTFESLKPDGAKLAFADARASRLAALYVPAGAAPSPFTAAGPFRATFEGDITQRLRGYVHFLADGRGKFTLSVNGVSVLEAKGEALKKTISPEVRLNKGRNHIVAVYESPASGDAQVRLLWFSKTWIAEPLPPIVLSHDTGGASLAKSTQLREGRFLLAEFRCTKCHAAAARDAKLAMPELAMDAPSLAGIGARLNQDWMAAWVSDPHRLRSSAHMPRLFAGNSDSRARDIAAYLASLNAADGAIAAMPKGSVVDGGRLYANLDCVACHTLPDAKDDPARISFQYVKAKFKPPALFQYLLRPDRHYAWNPMPDFRLSEPEAANLAAFLLSLDGGKIDANPGGDSVKGKQLFISSGCLNCHQAGDEKSIGKFAALAAIPQERLNDGCLGTEPAARGAAPDFALSADQRSAISSFLKTDRASLSVSSPAEFAERQIAKMRCTACHARDGRDSLLAQGLDAESQALHEKYPNPPPAPDEFWAADQRPPMLTWAGEKLRPQWTARFIAGGLAYKPRYYLRARMPAFRARAERLATGLAAGHGCAPALPPPPPPDPQQADAGRKLCSKLPNVGFSCVQCHSVQDVPPLSPFEAPSINFKYASERLQHDYYTRWVHDPLRIDPNSKMPRFDDADGKTGLPTYNGDGGKQFEAIWQYLLEGRSIQPPPQ